MKIFFSTMGIALAILLTASLISNTMVMQSINAQFAPSSTPKALTTTTAPSTTTTGTSLSPTTTTAPSTTTQTTTLSPQCIAAQQKYITAKKTYDDVTKLYMTNPGKYVNQWNAALFAKISAQNAVTFIPNCPLPR